MFKIIKASSGESLGMTEAPTYIKKADNGCYNLCPEPSEAPVGRSWMERRTPWPWRKRTPA